MVEFRLLFLIVCSVCFVNIQALTKLEHLTATYPKFAKLITDLGQETNLNNADIQTVVAPSDAAITAAMSAGTLGSDVLEQRQCIQTHFLAGNAFTNDMLSQQFATKTLIRAETKRGGKVYFNKYKNSFYVDNAKLEKEIPIDANNVIRGIDRVLCPYNTAKLFNTDTSKESYLKTEGATYFNRLFHAFASNKPNSKMLSSVDSFAGGTFFVPLDKYLTEGDPNVIASLESTVTELEKSGNVDKLEKILESHIIMNQFLAAAFLENDKEYPTFPVGKPIKVARKPGDASHPEILTVISGDSSADVIKPDELIGNGLVHGISGILNLLYKNLYAEIMTNVHTVGFKDLIPRAEDTIKSTLKNQTQNYTFFAVDNLGINDNEKVITLQSNQANLTKTLEKAIVPGEVLTLAKLKTMDGQKIITQNGEIEVKIENGEVRIICGQVKARIVKSDVETTNGIIQVLDLMLCVGGSTVYDVIARDTKLSTLKKYFDDFGFADVLKGTAMNITVIGAENSAFDDARKSKTELNNLLKDTTKTDAKYINDMKQFLSLFILTGAPKIEQGMTAILEARKVGASDNTRTVGFKGGVSGVKVNYMAQSVDVLTPYSRHAINGQLVVVDDVLVDLKDIKTGQVLGAATAKLHTGLALALMVFVMRFWW